jgi:hypothetical protein
VTGRPPARTRYGTFSLGSEQIGGLVHLRSALPEVIALGIDAWMEILRGEWPLGGPHAELQAAIDGPTRLHVVTPECEFTYEVMSRELDSAGPYALMRRVFVSTAYHAFAESLRG